jgi:hypothetical protein
MGFLLNTRKVFGYHAAKKQVPIPYPVIYFAREKTDLAIMDGGWGAGSMPPM